MFCGPVNDCEFLFLHAQAYIYVCICNICTAQMRLTSNLTLFAEKAGKENEGRDGAALVSLSVPSVDR